MKNRFFRPCPVGLAATQNGWQLPLAGPLACTQLSVTSPGLPCQIHVQAVERGVYYV